MWFKRGKEEVLSFQQLHIKEHCGAISFYSDSQREYLRYPFLLNRRFSISCNRVESDIVLCIYLVFTMTFLLSCP
jgi:hypothetical protein